MVRNHMAACWAALIGIGLASSASAAELAYASQDAASFDTGVSYEVSPICWQDSCCDAACGDACCDDGCCNDAYCGDSCCNSACCGDACCGGALGCLPGEGLVMGLLSNFKKSCGCFDEFISPMTNPTFFEDPRNVTEVRAIFLQHKVPLAALGGDVQLYALQLRARLTDRLSLLATRDGYVVSSNPLIADGWADVDLGLKYSLYRDPCTQTLLSVGGRYNLPVGAHRARQGRGDGLFDLFVTGGTQIGDCGHWLSSFGGNIPVDDDANSSFIYWSNHFDYQVRRGWYALTEFNWYHWTSNGDDRLGLGAIDGGDLFNLGSGAVEGNNIVTGAFGVKYKPCRNTEVGVAFEVPLTDRRDVLENRLTADLILRY